MYPARLVIYILIVLGTGACGGPEEYFYPPSMELRAKLGRIGLVSEPSAQPITYAAKATIVGSSNAADYGAEQAMYSCVGTLLDSAHDPFSFVGALMFSVLCPTVAAPIGAMSGASRARTQEEADSAKANIDAAMGRIVLREFHKAIATAYREKTKRQLTELGIRLQVPSGNAQVRDVDTILWIDLRGSFVHVDGRINPDVRLVLLSGVRLLKKGEERPLYFRTWRYEGPERTHFSYGENGGSRIREDVTEGFRMLAERIVYDLFVNDERERIYFSLCDMRPALCGSTIQDARTVRSVEPRLRNNWKDE